MFLRGITALSQLLSVCVLCELFVCSVLTRCSVHICQSKTTFSAYKGQQTLSWSWFVSLIWEYKNITKDNCLWLSFLTSLWFFHNISFKWTSHYSYSGILLSPTLLLRPWLVAQGAGSSKSSSTCWQASSPTWHIFYITFQHKFCFSQSSHWASCLFLSQLGGSNMAEIEYYIHISVFISV